MAVLAAVDLDRAGVVVKSKLPSASMRQVGDVRHLELTGRRWRIAQTAARDSLPVLPLTVCSLSGFGYPRFEHY